MIIRHTTQQVQDYYERIGINQSSLKVLVSDGVQSYLGQREQLIGQDDLYYEEKTHFIIGGAVDCILTQGMEVFKQYYHVSDLKKKPGDKALSVIRLAYDKACANFPLGPDVTMTLFKKEIFEACNEEKYYPNRAKATPEEDTRIESLLKDNGQAYWFDLCSADGKQILSDKEKMIIDAITMSLLTHPHTRSLFKDSKDIDIIYQYPAYWVYEGEDCKGLLDMIVINHAAKKIFPIDLKTMGDYVTRFNKAVRKRRYDIQGSFYTYGLQQNISSISSLINKSLAGYEIGNFAFIVESTVRSGCPLVFPLTDALLEHGANGDGKEFLGWKQGIDIYKKWVTVDFSLEEIVKDTNGVLFINENFDYPINL